MAAASAGVVAPAPETKPLLQTSLLVVQDVPRALTFCSFLVCMAVLAGQVAVGTYTSAPMQATEMAAAWLVGYGPLLGSLALASYFASSRVEPYAAASVLVHALLSAVAVLVVTILTGVFQGAVVMCPPLRTALLGVVVVSGWNAIARTLLLAWPPCDAAKHWGLHASALTWWMFVGMSLAPLLGFYADVRAEMGLAVLSMAACAVFAVLVIRPLAGAPVERVPHLLRPVMEPLTFSHTASAAPVSCSVQSFTEMHGSRFVWAAVAGSILVLLATLGWNVADYSCALDILDTNREEGARSAWASHTSAALESCEDDVAHFFPWRVLLAFCGMSLWFSTLMVAVVSYLLTVVNQTSDQQTRGQEETSAMLRWLSHECRSPIGVALLALENASQEALLALRQQALAQATAIGARAEHQLSRTVDSKHGVLPHVPALAPGGVGGSPGKAKHADGTLDLVRAGDSHRHSTAASEQSDGGSGEDLLWIYRALEDDVRNVSQPLTMLSGVLDNMLVYLQKRERASQLGRSSQPLPAPRLNVHHSLQSFEQMMQHLVELYDVPPPQLKRQFTFILPGDGPPCTLHGAVGMELVLEHGLWGYTPVAPSTLKQGLVNLFTNALKYGASGAPPTAQPADPDSSDDSARGHTLGTAHIAVKVAVEVAGDAPLPRNMQLPDESTFLSTAAGTLSVTVTDQGRGMAEQDLTSLFQPFTRLRSGQQQKGTGMGLWLMRELLKSQGGDLTAASAGPGCGCSFTLTLPVAMQVAHVRSLLALSDPRANVDEYQPFRVVHLGAGDLPEAPLDKEDSASIPHRDIAGPETSVMQSLLSRSDSAVGHMGRHSAASGGTGGLRMRSHGGSSGGTRFSTMREESLDVLSTNAQDGPSPEVVEAGQHGGSPGAGQAFAAAELFDALQDRALGTGGLSSISEAGASLPPAGSPHAMRRQGSTGSPQDPAASGAGTAARHGVPLTPGAAAALQRGPESRARSKRRSSAMSSEAAGLRILLVDDSKPLRRQLSRSLERLGATVSTAVDGADALQVIGTTKDQIHVILCDLSMPVMDGPGLASALRTAGVLRKLRGSADGTSQPPAMPFVLSTVKAHFKVPQPGVEGGPSAVESSPSSQASRALTPTGSTRDASGLPPSDIGSTTELTGTVALKATASSSGGSSQAGSLIHPAVGRGQTSMDPGSAQQPSALDSQPTRSAGELAALFPGLAFVGLTGNGVQEDLVRFRQAGAHLVLTKPSSAKDIIASAARVLLALHAELG